MRIAAAQRARRRGGTAAELVAEVLCGGVTSRALPSSVLLTLAALDAARRAPAPAHIGR